MNREPVIVISGAGPVGLAIAALLAQAPAACRVQVIDPRPAPRWRADEFDLRVFALSRSSQSVFECLGLWSHIVGRRACAYERMRVFEGESPRGWASLDFDAADIGEPDLGHIVEDVILRDTLHARVATSPNVEQRLGDAVAAIEVDEDAATVQLESGESIRAQLVIAADGGQSPARRMLGLETLSRGYGQRAIVAHVGTGRAHAHTAWQRFLPGGPLALLPLGDGRSSVVWSLPESEALRLLDVADEPFLDELNRASAGVLGRLGPTTARAAFPLRIQHALRYVGPRAALAGDAAHVVHPLAGQGMNLGLADAACLARTLRQALAEGRDPGDALVLRRYERERKGSNLAMMAGLDALHHVFRFGGPLAPVRALGMAAINAAMPPKRWLMRQALGLHECEAPRGVERSGTA